MSEEVSAALRVLPDYLGQHVLLSAASLSLGLLLSLPLAVAASRSARLRWPLLAFASLIQTIPSIALLALFYPLLLALSTLAERFFGQGFSALGFLPSLLALTLYSMLPILRNGVAAIVNIDPAVIEAARGVGMTDRQRLLKIELPLAAPVLMAGVRTAAVWVIGTATLATPVGQTSLGNYIFSGLQVQNWVSVLFGCAVAAALALLVDQLLGLIEAGVAKRSWRRVAIGAAALLAGVAAAVAPVTGTGSSAYVIGAKSFSEQYILSALMAERIRAQGAPATRKVGLASMVAFRALAGREIDAYVDYSGTIWANVMKRTGSASRETMLAEMARWLRREYGVTMLGPLGFENAYVLAMRRDHAESLGIRTIADLARHAPALTMGGDFEFFARPEWSALRAQYGLEFASRREFQSTFMYQAVASGEVDVISAFSSDGRIAAYDLVVLEDPRQVIPPYDAVILLSPARAADPLLRAAFEPLIDAIPIGLMRQANLMVDRDDDKLTPVQAARWLSKAAGLDAAPTGGP